MVQSAAKTVEDFLSDVQPDRLDAIRRIRALCQTHLVGWEERMQWGMPGYGPTGSDNLISFNNQKNYISIYPGRSALEEHRLSLRGASFGGGCVRFANPAKIDFAAVEAMLRASYLAKSK